MHFLCPLVRGESVFLPVHDEGRHTYLMEAVGGVIVARGIALPDNGIIRLRIFFAYRPQHRSFEYNAEQAARPGHGNPFDERRDEDEAFNLFWMLEREICGDAPSHGNAQHMGLFDAERSEEPCGIIGHHLYRIRDIRLSGSPRAAVIECDDFIVLREFTNHPFILGDIGCQPSDEDKRLTLAVDLIRYVDILTVSVGILLLTIM